MQTRLFVGNLSDDVSVAQLRERFAESGVVIEVDIPTDRASGRRRGYAFVTMASSADARSAVDQLDGATLDERRLRVNEAGDNREHSRSRGGGDAPRVRITSQFRERCNMAYELDCTTATIALKMFPTETRSGGEQWRVDVSANGVADVLVKASAPTRALAMVEIAKLWTQASNVPDVDWDAVTKTLASVRAV